MEKSRGEALIWSAKRGDDKYERLVPVPSRLLSPCELWREENSSQFCPVSVKSQVWTATPPAATGTLVNVMAPWWEAKLLPWLMGVTTGLGGNMIHCATTLCCVGQQMPVHK